MFKSIIAFIIFLSSNSFASVCTKDTIESRLQISSFVQDVVSLYAENNNVDCDLTIINVLEEIPSDGEPYPGFIALYYCPQKTTVGYRTIAVTAYCANGDLADKPVDPISISFGYAL